ncbi:tRNA lysidine(34) synthetase TilS [Oerskovia jenensis]|uniref:tRNA(Ile)-lysidine synthase n=1 Tax=Oerskovia jenensis TaxID=162169 RepID=A0ABS2LHQ2_9CELL|nr:tRNA lysidine(34) synthetase TilS [Oerskovia jenensis]MBM7479946.1 tRNA(Ile)-lysidine synthetase-like protein [Oerskovia jenensis]
MVGPHPAEAAARRAVRGTVRDLAPGALVLVACSGGADSLALAAATAFVASRDGLRAGAVVVDHGLQAGSAEVAAVAAAQCRALGLAPVEVRRADVAGRGGLEAAARHARYTVLDDVARVAGASAVLLGHTLDDQAESVLLGLARGSGARSLAGMAAVRGAYRRPFLSLRRTDTEDVCTANGLTWWTDPTNGGPAVVTSPDRSADPSGPAMRHGAPLPLRSQVRARVLPVLEDVLGPGVAVALARTAGLLREDADLLDELAGRLLDEARAADPADLADLTDLTDLADPADPVDHKDPGAGNGGRRGDAEPRTSVAPVVLDTQVLRSAPAALRRRALRRAATEAGSPAGSLFASHVATLDAMITDWRGQGPAHLPGDVRALRTRGRLFLRPAHPPSPERTVPAETPAEPAQE